MRTQSSRPAAGRGPASLDLLGEEPGPTKWLARAVEVVAFVAVAAVLTVAVVG